MSPGNPVDPLNAALTGRYHLLRELGEGGMATVYLADDLKHERRVALKVLKPGPVEAMGAERFLTEVRTTANLQHPHVLPLFDSGEAGGFLFYVMPFVEGESLQDRLDREGTLPVAEAIRLTTLVASALQYAHDQGIIHRDVKPANIMMSGDLPVMADFGIALPMRQDADERTTKALMGLGTMRYASPEQMLGGDVDPRSDQYSLACVLYELLAGQASHVGPTDRAVLMKKITSAPDPVRSLRPDVPEHVDEAILRALAVEPGDRFPDMRSFAAALRDGGAGSGPRALRAAGNLPAQATSLVGRDLELDEVLAALEGARLITLFGMGGLGKTRLAIEAARRAAPNFPDGAWFVDLAAVTEESAVGHAAAGVFGVTQQPGMSIEQSLVQALGGRRLLLVLDNCEHVTGAAAALAHGILGACPDVKIVATSREALSVSGERVWPVSGLTATDADAPAVQLFAERARAVSPDFEVGADADVIRRICARLDGIPLAIELAAARTRSLSPTQILERLGERFRLLTGGSRAPDAQRHQTLRQAVQWSYDLLTEPERAVLNRASVFAGGFTLEAAERVCAGGDVDEFDVLDRLDSLVGKSLLQVERTDSTVRYGMLETIRSFGAEALAAAGEEAATRGRHATFFADQSDRMFEIWRSPRELAAYEWLDFEINNLRVAFRWALENDAVDVAARIASDVGDVGRFRLREEAAFWAEEIVDRAREVQHRRLAVLLTWCASSAWAFSRFDDAQRFGDEALALRDDPAFDPFIWAYGDLAFVALLQGQIDRALEYIKAGAAHPTDARDRFMLAFQLYLLATTGHTDEALKIADDVVQKTASAGVPMSIAVAYGGKGAALEATDPTAALAFYERSVDVSRESGNRFMEALIAPRIAALHARSGEPATALRGFERMLASFGEATDIASVSAWRAALVVLLAKLGHHEAAATLHGTFAASIDAAGVFPEHPEALERVREGMSADAFEAATRRGAAMSLREASNYAVEQVKRGLASLEE